MGFSSGYLLIIMLSLATGFYVRPDKTQKLPPFLQILEEEPHLSKESDTFLGIRNESAAPPKANRIRRQIDQRFENGRPLECQSIEDEEPSPPLMCYQCKSNFDEKNPVCDHTLWRYARRREKYALRIQCPVSRGSYCVKIVQHGTNSSQMTERGCFGPGPFKGVQLQEGCIRNRKVGSVMTICFCKTTLCNLANIQSNLGAVSLVLLGLSIVARSQAFNF